jgi:RNA polymerase sigma-70 factor (ECF subfamily)
LLDHQRESLFRAWLYQHGGTIVKVARAYTQTGEDCQDLAQEILLQVWRSLPQFEGRATAATWSYRVALNTALTWRRNERVREAGRQPLFEIHELQEPAGNDQPRPEYRELIERLYNAIHQLPKADAALVLLYLDDLSYRQMAEVLGISESNVGVKLNRAKKALAELMKDVHES